MTCSRLQVLMNSYYLLIPNLNHTSLSYFVLYHFWQGKETMMEVFVLVLLKGGWCGLIGFQLGVMISNHPLLFHHYWFINFYSFQLDLCFQFQLWCHLTGIRDYFFHFDLLEYLVLSSHIPMIRMDQSPILLLCFWLILDHRFRSRQRLHIASSGLSSWNPLQFS